MSALPEGWDLDRVRSLESSAALLDPAEHTIFSTDGRDYQELGPAVCVISFSGHCLVRLVGDDQWWMGQLDESDGSIVCWNPYGEDLEAAIHAL